MDDNEAKELVKKVFKDITQATTIDTLKAIENDIDIKYRIDLKQYPEINFSISPEDIQDLQSKGYLNEQFELSNNLSEASPLLKLLYSLAWKNGDLKKIKHIAKGIFEARAEKELPKKAIVFYQFGRHLTKINSQPIIDQHIFRAFAVWQAKKDCISEYRKNSTIREKDIDLVNKYIKWLYSEELNALLRSSTDYTYHIDKILFAIGKSIKL